MICDEKKKKNAARIWAWLSQIPYHWATGHNTHVSDHWTLIGKPNLGHRRATSVYAGMRVRMHFPCVKFCLPHSQANPVNEKFLHCMRQKAGWDLGTTQWVWYLPVVLFLVQFNNFDWNTNFYGSYMLLFKPPVLMRSCGSYWQLFSWSLEVGGMVQEKKKQEKLTFSKWEIWSIIMMMATGI